MGESAYVITPVSTFPTCHARMDDMSNLTSISKGYAVVTINGEHIGQVEYAEMPRTTSRGGVEIDRFWFAGDLTSGTYGHLSDRIGHAAARGETRGEAVGAFLARVTA